MFVFGVVLVAAGGSLADDTKGDQKPRRVEVKITNGPKADVAINGNEKVAAAKAGQVVQVAFGMPLSPPFPSDFEVKIDGAKVDSKVYDGGVHFDGRPTPAAAVKLVQFKAAGEGKRKVLIEYKQGQQRYRRELELDVKK
jgi:hypothetical protein